MTSHETVPVPLRPAYLTCRVFEWRLLTAIGRIKHERRKREEEDRYIDYS